MDLTFGADYTCRPEQVKACLLYTSSICDVAEEVIDYLNAHGEKVGLVKVRLIRFSL